MRRPLAVLALSLAAAFAIAAVPTAASAASAASAAPDLAAANFAWVNALRAAAGLNALQEQAWAQDVAQAHTLDMATQGNLFHNMTGYMGPGHAAMGASFLGENVGTGSNLDYTQSLLLASPGHMANILNPRFNYVGVAAAVDAGGVVWITEDFAEIHAGAGPAPAAVANAVAPKVVASPQAAAAPTPASKPAAAAPKAVASPTPAGTRAVVAPKAVASTVATPSAAASPLAPVRAEAVRMTVGAAPTGHTAPVAYALLAIAGVTFPLGLGYAISRRI